MVADFSLGTVYICMGIAQLCMKIGIHEVLNEKRSPHIVSIRDYIDQILNFSFEKERNDGRTFMK